MVFSVDPEQSDHKRSISENFEKVLVSFAVSKKLVVIQKGTKKLLVSF